MKRVLISGLAVGMLLGAMQIAMPAQADVLKGETVAKTSIEGGELTISATNEIDFGTLKLGNELVKTITKPGDITVSDYRGSYAGWNVTVAKADVATWDNALEIELTGVTGAVNTAQKNFATQAKVDGYDLEQEKLFDATLNVPNKVKVGTYSTTLTWTLGIGPENN